MSERPSPSKIGVCALIALYSDPNSPLNELLEEEIDATTSTGDAPPPPHRSSTIASFIERSVIGGGGGTTTCGGNNTDASLSTWLHEIHRTVDGGSSRRGQSDHADDPDPDEYSSSVAYLVQQKMKSTSIVQQG